MKKIIFVTAFHFLFACFIFAHSPKEIKLSFNNETKILKAEISQKEIIVQAVTEQRKGNIQEFVFTIPDAGIGDTIKVRAECSVFGSRTKLIKVIKQGKAVTGQEKSGAKRIK